MPLEIQPTGSPTLHKVFLVSPTFRCSEFLRDEQQRATIFTTAIRPADSCIENPSFMETELSPYFLGLV